MKFWKRWMIYAQRPDATACADYDIWNNRMNRYVRRGSKGIALLDESSGYPRLHYVFDVSDTGVRRNSRDPERWEMNDDLFKPVSEMLTAEYGISHERLSQQLVNIAEKLVNDYWDNNSGDILNIVDGSFFDARNIEAIRTLFKLEREHRGATPEEQQVLSQYVGWGGLADAFDPNKDGWAKEYTELKGLLSEDEYAAARSSTLNAHYTSPTVIRGIYDAVERMGFRSGNILEPSMGVGNFFGMLPDSMADSRLYGVELDSITGRIAKMLYPQADITVAGFETTDRRDFYDLAVGNVPFGQYKVNDKAYNKLGFSIKKIQKDLEAKQKELDDLKAETILVIRGVSALDKELLGTLVAEAREALETLEKQLVQAQEEYEEATKTAKRSNYICNELFTWADVYDTANHDERRAILQQFIKEIRVRKDYEISITLNASFSQVEQLKAVSTYDGADIFEEISEKGA